MVGNESMRLPGMVPVPPAGGASRRIAMVLPRSDVVAGASVHIAQLCTALNAQGSECRVYVGGNGQYRDYLERRGIDVESVPGLSRAIRPHSDTIALVGLLRRIGEFEPHLIAAHTAKAGLLSRLVGRIRNIPVVYTPHGWAFFDGVPRHSAALYLAVERMAARLGGPTIAVSEYERVFAIASRVSAAERIIRIPNGIPDIGPDGLARPSVSPPRLSMVARFDPQKNQSTLVRALDQIRHLEWSMTFVGTGELFDNVKALSVALDLADRITFAGNSDDVPSHLANTQIFVLSSNWESYPLSILEAMRAGLPSVVTDVGGSREIVVDGLTGALVPRGNVDALANALGRLVSDPNLRDNWGKRARELFVERHTEARMIESTVRLYDVVTQTS